MNEEYHDSIEFKERKSKNLLWIGCISIVMIFAGLTSAYLVVRADNFWVKMSLPSWFIISTVVILLTSLTFYLALKFAKKDNKKLVKVMMTFTMLGGIIFTYSQFKGWGQLINSGYYMVGKVTADGYYGQHLMVSYNGKNINSNAPGEYDVDGVELSEKEKGKLEAFFVALSKADHANRVYDIQGFDEFKLIGKFGDRFRPLSFDEGKLKIQSPDGDYEESPGLAMSVKSFANNMVNKTGYFQMKGNYGSDFEIMYKNVPVTLKNNAFYAGDNRLSEKELAQLEDTQNTASSFTYILSGLHLLHLLGGWIYILVLFFGSMTEKYGAHNWLKIKLGSIYWHFLGGLWIFLYLFLQFIH